MRVRRNWGTGTAPSQAPPPEPVSVQEYDTTLAGAVDPLESALKGLAKAKAYKGLDRPYPLTYGLPVSFPD